MNTQIYEEASQWMVEFRSGDVDADLRRRFDAWIRKSPEHLQAYLEIAEIWQDAACVGGTKDTAVADLAAATREHHNIVSLPLSAHAAANAAEDIGTQSQRVAARRRSTLVAYVAAASLLIVCAAAAAWYYAGRNTYETATGEQRTLNLADGTVVQVNSQSRLTVDFTTHVRNIRLEKGQALFHVAPDKLRPFIVAGNNTQVRAVGTQFDVYLRHGATIVTVVEGSVAAVETKETKAPPLVLTAGEQATLDPRAPPHIERGQASVATAWADHRLVFKSSPLTEVVEEFNRYNTRRLVVENGNFDDFHVSGVYSSADPTLLIRFLSQQPELRIRETPAAVYIARARSQPP